MSKRGAPGAQDDKAIVPTGGGQRPNPITAGVDPPAPTVVSPMSLQADNTAKRARVDAFPLRGSMSDEKIEEMYKELGKLLNSGSEKNSPRPSG